MIRLSFKLACIVFFVALSIVPSEAQIGQKMKTVSTTGITGLWRNSSMGFNMDLLLEQGGKGKFDGDAISYQFSGTTMSVTTNGIKTLYQAKMAGDELTLSGGDLDMPITFKKINPDGDPSNGTTPKNSSNTKTGTNTIFGTWTAQNEEISFTADGQMIYNGSPLSYTLEVDKIIVKTPNGSVIFLFTLNGDYLTLKNENLNAMYTRKTGSSGTPSVGSTASPSQSTDGVIDPSMVGKWAYVGTANNISGTFSNEEYITLKGDGTYEYYHEASGTASGTDMYGNQTFAGGTASSSSDRGTWRVKGNTIIANSQKSGMKVYQLQKRNHPKNGDPMIILDGTAYVTYYQKPPWR